MLWIIEPPPSGKPQALSKNFAADRDRLVANEHLAIANVEVSLSLAHAMTPMAPGAGDIYVLVHSSAGDPPWIGGMYFAKFATTFVAKCGGSANVDGRTVWILGCYIGALIPQLLAHFATAGVQNLTIYSPTGLMWISNAGIPHVYQGKKTLEQVNTILAKYNSDYVTVIVSEPQETFGKTGEDWVGATLAPAGVTPLAGTVVEDDVRDHFDPDDQEG
jgi:hypothetical protein